MLLIAIMTTAFAAALPAEHPVTITLSHHHLAPARIEVEVGEMVTWRSASGERLELRFDFHPEAHDVIARTHEVRAFFRKPGEHSYAGRVRDGRTFRGVVRVRERNGAALPPTPQCDQSQTLCLVP